LSSILIAGNTSGTITLDAPAVAGTTTLTLPTTSGTIVTTATSTGVSGSAISTGTVGVAYGGTGANTLTANNVLLGNGTSAVQFVAPSTNGNILTSNGTTWTSAAPPSSTPTTAQVLSATAGASAGAVGTYAMLGNNGSVGSAAITVGSNYAGSEYTFIGFRRATGEWSASSETTVQSGFAGGTGSGTWKAMGQYNSSAGRAGTLFLRVA